MFIRREPAGGFNLTQGLDRGDTYFCTGLCKGERWHCLIKMLVTKPRQLRDGSRMTMIPKLALKTELRTEIIHLAWINAAIAN